MGKGLRVAVADDDAAVRTLMNLWLTELGHTVTAVADGRPLVELCRADCPDLVISDVGMPEMDGLTAAANIRGASAVPIILMSGAWTADGEAHAAGLEAHVLQKPVNPLDLVAAIAVVTRNAGPKPPPADPLTQLIEADGDHALFTLDRVGRVTATNRGTTSVLGYDGDLLGRPWDVLFPPDGRSPADHLRAADGAGRAEVDGWVVRKDGAKVWARGTVTALPRAAGYGLILRDRTAERARELAAAARLAALEEADAKRTAFLATLSHELRNQLFPLLNCAQLVQLRAPASDVRDIGVMLERQVRRMSREVEELMDVARVRQGKVRLDLRPVDLGEVVRQAVDVVASRVEEAGHTLTVAVPEGPPRVNGDSDRLVQAVVNLLANAVKYTSPGGRIGVAVAADGDHAVVRVTDTGVGLTADRLDAVFDLFSQDDRSLSHAQGGLGIGLALVKELVTLHGGTVRALSDGIDQGSAFEVRLPAAG